MKRRVIGTAKTTILHRGLLFKVGEAVDFILTEKEFNTLVVNIEITEVIELTATEPIKATDDSPIVSTKTSNELPVQTAAVRKPRQPKKSQSEQKNTPKQPTAKNSKSKKKE